MVVRPLVGRTEVDADFKDDKGWTPLALAAPLGHEVIVSRLQRQ